MTPTLFFVHGTGGRDVSGTVEEIQRGVRNVLKWDPKQVKPIEWGNAVGPEDLDINLVLPPRYTRGAGLRGFGQDLTDSAGGDEVAVWEMLLAEPTAELQILSLQDPASIVMDGEGVCSIPPRHRQGNPSRRVCAAWR